MYFRVNETLEDIYLNVQWISTNYDLLKEYLITSNGDSDSSSWWDETDNIILFVFLCIGGLFIIILIIYCIKRKRSKKRINLQPLFGAAKKGKYSEMADRNDDQTGYGATIPNRS